MAERILAACTLVLAGIYLYATSTLPSFEHGDPLGPRAFPVLLGVLFALAGVLLLVESRARGPAAAPPLPHAGLRKRAVGGVAAATLAFIVLLEPLGYLVAITLYLSGVMRWLHGRRALLCLAISILFALGSYSLFVKGLGVALAKGIFHF